MRNGIWHSSSSSADSLGAGQGQREAGLLSEDVRFEPALWLPGDYTPGTASTTRRAAERAVPTRSAHPLIQDGLRPASIAGLRLS
jgi:hypothetical protein